MFTGLIQAIGVVKSVEPCGSGRRYEIKTPLAHEHFTLGASICCSGACMTVVKFRHTKCGQTRFVVEVSSESLDKTTLAAWDVGHSLNLEPAVRPMDPLGGHIVSGHVDGVAKIVAIETHENFTHFTIAPPADLARYVAQKGSVTLDGTSLTVNAVDEKDTFTLMLIPHTLEHTTWGLSKVGDTLNMEVDMLARYVERLLGRA